MATSRAEAATETAELFDRKETLLVEEALTAIGSRSARDAKQLEECLTRLAQLNHLLLRSPSLRNPRQLVGEKRSEKTLTEYLTGIDGLSGELELPLKATLSRSFLLGKIQFLRALCRCTTELRQESDDVFHRLTHDLTEEYAQSIYTLLAEELLLALLRKPNVIKPCKRRAADQLISVWDNAQLEIDDFCPLLEAAWHARNRINGRLGCLMGTSEYFRLVCEDCPPQFLDFFARDEVSRPEKQAFEEFLFNMTFEELQMLGNAMREHGLDTIDAAFAADILGRPIEELDHSGEIDPMALYRSYYRRQLAADFRIMADADGPRRTAEAYLMIWLLNQQE